MMRFHRYLWIAFMLFFLFLLSSCLPRMTVKERVHYKLYENVYLSATTFGTWTKTKISIPKGAIVAVMAKGKIWDITGPT